MKPRLPYSPVRLPHAFVSHPVPLRLQHTFFYAMLFLSACHQTRIVPAHAPRLGQTRLGITDRSVSYFAGYFEGASIRADCEEGVDTIVMARGIADTVLQILAGGVISTRRIEVRCVIPHLDEKALQRGELVALRGIYFVPGEARLHKDSQVVIDELVAFLRSHAGTMILLVNHTDLNVPYPQNEALSLSRSAAIRDALVRQGIDAQRIAVTGRGAQAPIVQAYDGVASRINNRSEAIVWNAPVLSPPFPAFPGQMQTAPLPSTLPIGEAEITMLDGRVLQGKVVHQAGDHIQAILDGKLVVLQKNQISNIRYGQTGH